MLGIGRAFRSFLRRHTKKKDPHTALRASGILTAAYAFIAWNLLGYIIYKAIRSDDSKKDKSDNKPWYLGKVTNLDENTKIYKISGFQFVEQKEAVIEPTSSPDIDTSFPRA